MSEVTYSTPVIVTGSRNTSDSAIEWLKLFCAQTEDLNEVTLISLPENARIDKGIHTDTYVVTFESQLYDDETYVEILLYPDARETEVTFEPDDKFKGIRDHVVQSYGLKYKEGVLIDYIKLEYTEDEKWEVVFNAISHTESVTLPKLDMCFDFVDNKFVVVRPVEVKPIV